MNAQDIRTRARAYLAKMPPAISGSGGHLATFNAAQVLVRGFDLEEGAALGLLRDHYNPRCQPPWSERDLQHKIRSAAKDSQRERGYLLDGNRGPGSRGSAAKPAANWSLRRAVARCLTAWRCTRQTEGGRR